MKTIKTIALVLVTLFTITTLSNTSFALSQEMKTAIETSKKVEAKRIKYENTVKRVTGVLEQLTAKYSTGNKESIGISKYKYINGKIDEIISKYEKKNSIYKKVTINFLNEVKNLINLEIVKLENIKKGISNDSSTKTTSGKDPKKTEDIVKKASTTKLSVSEQTQYREELEKNGLSKKESRVLTIQTDLNDGFKFCANFPAEVYDNNALRFYTDAQSSVAEEYKNFMATYYKVDEYYLSAYTDRNNKEKVKLWRTASKNGARIQQCVQIMYYSYKDLGLTKSDIKAIYEKHYGTKYVPYTTPFYLEGVQPENIETYIENHHK